MVKIGQPSGTVDAYGHEEGNANEKQTYPKVELFEVQMYVTSIDNGHFWCNWPIVRSP